jgi:hypothetical protein
MKEKIKINNNKKVASVQKEFSHIFPYLRLEFFSKQEHGKRGMEKKNVIIPADKTIGECRKVHKNDSISVTPGMKVSSLEEMFQEDFGLYVQVFRKSGKVWLETTMTDDWTLAEQNKQGEELSKPVHKKEKPFRADDYHDLE